MDAELTKDIEELRGMCEQFTIEIEKVKGSSPALAEHWENSRDLYRRTIARLESLAVGEERAEKAELAAALEELAANKCVADLLKAAMTHLAAAQQREAKLRELCKANVWLYPYQVLRVLDGKGGE